MEDKKCDKKNCGEKNCANWVPIQGYWPGDRFTLFFDAKPKDRCPTLKRQHDCMLAGENGTYRLVYLFCGGFPGCEYHKAGPENQYGLPFTEEDINKMIGNADRWVCIYLTRPNKASCPICGR